MDDGGAARRHGVGARSAAVLVASLLGTGSAGAQVDTLLAGVATTFNRLQPHSAANAAILTGLVIFSTILSLLHLRERARWTRRERAFAGTVASLRGAFDRAEMLLGTERQVIVTWEGRGDPTVEGDPALAFDASARPMSAAVALRRVLAFGTWLGAADAAALEAAVETLRDRGERFRLSARTTGGRHVEAEGRAVGGRALLRLRDVTGDRLDLLDTRERLEEVRREAEGLRGLLDAIPQPVWRRDRGERLAYANRAYLRAVEAGSLAAAREGSLDLLDRAAREEAARARRTGQPYQARVTAVLAGARRMLDVTEAPLPEGSGGIAVDVSELDGARGDLHLQAEANARTFDQLPTAVAIFDAGQHLVFHNAAYRQLFGLDSAFLDTRPLEGEILDRLRVARKLPEQANYREWKRDVLAAYHAVETQQSWWFLPDNRTLRVAADPNPRGGLTYLFDDVSERVGLEARYNALMRVQNETLDTLAEAVSVFGADGRLKFANRAFATAWRLDPDAIAGQPHIDAIIARGRELSPSEEPWTEIRGAVTGLSDARLGVTCRLERVDGTVLDCGTQPLPDGATLLTFIDVTASVNVERALTDKNDALERAATLRDEFVHHVSYELRSPLTNIIGFTELLGDQTVGPLNQRQREYAEHIMRSSGALLAIINDILDLATIDTGAIEIVREVVDIRETVAAAIRGVEDRVAESAIRLVVDVPEDIGSFVADGKRLRQILFNLLSNAIGFSEAGQSVEVRARRTPTSCIFEVVDHGRGMPAELCERAFERFESHTLGTRHRGVGLGLSIVRSFVELHGGEVALASAPGQGTRVTCTLPLEAEPHRAAAE